MEAARNKLVLCMSMIIALVLACVPSLAYAAEDPPIGEQALVMEDSLAGESAPNADEQNGEAEPLPEDDGLDTASPGMPVDAVWGSEANGEGELEAETSGNDTIEKLSAVAAGDLVCDEDRLDVEGILEEDKALASPEAVTLERAALAAENRAGGGEGVPSGEPDSGLDNASASLTSGDSQTSAAAGDATASVLLANTASTQAKPESKPQKVDIAKARATIANAVYTGKAIKPDISLSFQGKILVNGKDYAIKSWKDNVRIGVASVVIAGKGDFSGTRTLSFKIVGKPSYSAGATSMPVASTSVWKLTNAKLKLVSGSSISFKGGTVTANRAGTSKLAVVNLLGAVVKSFTVKVYALNGVYVIRSAVGGSQVLDILGASKDDAATAQIYRKNGTQAQAFRFKRAGSTYVILNANSGKAVDVAGASNKDQTDIRQWRPNGTNAQKWRITVDSKNRLTFLNAGSGKAMDVAGAQAKSRTNVQLYRSNGTNAQKWMLSVAPVKYVFGASKMPLASTSAWSVTNGSLKVISGSAVTVSGKTVKGAKVGKAVVAVLDSVGGQVAKRTVSVYELDSYYTLNSALGHSLVLDIAGAGKGDGVNARLWQRNGTLAQAYRFTRSGSSYVVTNANSGRVLDVEGGMKGDSANVRQWVSNGTGAQKWRIVVDRSNRLTFINVSSGKALDISCGRAANGANAQQYASNGTNAQKWTLTAVAPAYKAGNYLAAAAVALSGFGGKKSPTSPGYYTRPPDIGYGGDWTVYNKVYDAMGSNVSKNHFTDCAGNAAMAVRWSGIDDDYPKDPWVNIQHAYLVSSDKWTQIGSGAYRLDEIQTKLKLQPGDLLLHPNGDGTYSHIGIYTGAAANELKYPGAGYDYVQAARGMKKWMYTLPLARADYGWYTFEVFRRTETGVNVYSSKYADIYPEERAKYLVNGS